MNLSKKIDDEIRYNEYKKELENYTWLAPRIPSFERLSIIYEKQKNYETQLKYPN